MKLDSEVAKNLRRLLSGPSNTEELCEYLDQLDAEVLAISASGDEAQARQDFEETLQVVYDEEVDHSRLQQLEIFLAVLYHARSILPPSSLISTWFELLIRPGLREPRLASCAVEQSKQLVLRALDKSGEPNERADSFRRRLLDLFLLDVLNESSEKDIFQWAELDEVQREKNQWWKNNLEDIIVRYGLQFPDEFLAVLNDCFVMPSSRLQILTLLDSFITHPSFLDLPVTILSHTFLQSLLRSLEVDNSSTVCAVELAVLVKLLPVAAIKGYDGWRRVLPRLFGVLGRVLCWKSRGGRSSRANKVAYSDLLDYNDESLVAELERKEDEDEMEAEKKDEKKNFKVRDDLGWETLERTFDMSTSSLPVPRQFFSFLYYLFPCNLVDFLRHPSEYLLSSGIESPWTENWNMVLDELQIRTAGSLLLRTHIMNPSTVWHNITTELEEFERWSTYDVSRIVGECMMLDASMASLVHREEAAPYDSEAPEPSTLLPSRGDVTTTQTPTIQALNLGTVLPSRQRKVSLRDIIATSVALKSGADINVSDNTTSWPSILFTPPPASPLLRATSSHSLDDARLAAVRPGADEVQLPSEISETIAGLQREVLLLRTELNFELWLKRENIRHIGRLHQDEVKRKGAELEQQRLQNRLREYRSQLLELQKELRNHQEQAQKIHTEHAAWNASLSTKLNDLRDQKKKWMADSNSLRSEKNDLHNQLAAQGDLLAEAQKRVFQLETEIKMDAPKVKRLRDYEKRIDQLTTMLRMWNKDIVLYNEQSNEMSELISEYQKMKLRVEAHEKAQEELEATARASRRQIQILEASLRSARKSSEQSHLNPFEMMSAQTAERDALAKNNKALRTENAELRDEIEEVRAMVEVLKAQVTGRAGLVNPDALIQV